MVGRLLSHRNSFPSLPEEVPRKTDSIELARGHLGMPTTISKRDHVVAREQGVELELNDPVTRRSVQLQVRVGNVLKNDCPTI